MTPKATKILAIVIGVLIAVALLSTWIVSSSSSGPQHVERHLATGATSP